MKSKTVSSADNVRVICRVRPMNEKEEERLASSDSAGRRVCTEFNPSDKKSITVFTPVEKLERDKDPFDKHTFSFDHVFPCNSRQAEVYEVAALPTINGILEGFNGCILAYGQTSSGKTYTMQGDLDDAEVKGIIPRLVDTLFERIEKAGNKIEFSIKAGMIEIYNERLKDLLNTNNEALTVREEKHKGVFLENLTEVSISSADEVYTLMKSGNNNRAVAYTNMNAQSSRSHSIFVLNLTINDLEGFSCKTSVLHLVDLAGSEMISKTGATGKTLEEAKNINKSLTVLGRVINALTDGKSDYIPYRDSKLTRILQNSLGGNAKTCLIITASPSIHNASETLSTCRFGMRAKNIKNKAVVNKIPTIAELELVINRLRIELAKNSRRVALLEALVEDLGGRVAWKGGVADASVGKEAAGEGGRNGRENCGNEGNEENEDQAINEDKEEVVEEVKSNGDLVGELIRASVNKSYGEDIDTLLNQIKKERDRAKKKADDIELARRNLKEKESELSSLNAQLTTTKHEQQGITKQHSPSEQSSKKSYSTQDHNRILHEEQKKYTDERAHEIESIAKLTRQNVDLRLENERLTEQLSKLEGMQSEEAMQRSLVVLQESLGSLNQMYHMKLNQDAVAKYDLELQKSVLGKVTAEKSKLNEEIMTMRSKINALTEECKYCKDYIRDKVPNGAKILENPELNKVSPIFIDKHNVVKRIRGGGGSSKDCFSMVQRFSANLIKV
eukprot:TRINITY_DN2894_c0_g3_i1.p1 TRINITY_DN2894_c0_g3~~TRINITY_DN2894_c0_g3_i1.p1  ORF type:complete len:732 (-),score=224.34 TRINITY_DN2894_c0_g3_i1:134-2329(-)